jgi:hypothetical protein
VNNNIVMRALLCLVGLVLCNANAAVGEANGTEGHHGVTLASWRWDEYR